MILPSGNSAEFTTPVAAGGLDGFDNGCGCRFHVFFVDGDTGAVVYGAPAGESGSLLFGDHAGLCDA